MYSGHRFLLHDGVGSDHNPEDVQTADFTPANVNPEEQENWAEELYNRFPVKVRVMSVIRKGN